MNSLDSTILSTRVEVSSYKNDKCNTMYSPIYYYRVDNKQYICKSNFSSSVYPGIKNKNVYYDSKNPSSCMTEDSKSNSYILLVFLIIPLVFIVIGFVNINKINKRIKLILELN